MNKLTGPRHAANIPPMNSRRAICGAGMIGALLPTAPAAQATRRAYELGVDAADNYRYSEALMHFQKAAEGGDREARRNLGLMLLYGHLLYGKEVERNQDQGRRWLRAAANDGCEVSAFMLKVMASHGG